MFTSLRFLVGNSFIVRCYVSFGEHALQGKKADVHYMHTFFLCTFLVFQSQESCSVLVVGVMDSWDMETVR